MLKFSSAACQRYSFGGRQRRPLQGNPASDRMLRGPGCNRHSRVCPDTSVPFAGLPRRFYSDGHRDAFSRHDGIYRSDVVQNQKPNPGTGTVPPPVGRPRARVQERAGRITLFSSSAMSSGRLFLRLLASRASLRFTGDRRITRTPQRLRPKATFLLCWKGDISTLP